jgi:hypothetical protein
LHGCLDRKVSASQKAQENLGVMLKNSRVSGQPAQTLTGALIAVMLMSTALRLGGGNLNGRLRARIR